MSTTIFLLLCLNHVTGFLDLPLLINNPLHGGSFLERAKSILRRVPLVDGHNDLPWHTMQAFKGQLSGLNLKHDTRTQFPYDPTNPSQTDIPRLRQGLLGAQMWSGYTRCGNQYKDAVRWGLSMIDLIKRMVHKYHDTLQFVTTADGIMNAFRKGKIASMIGMEGGHMIDSSLAVLRMFYELGVRYLTLTWSCDTPWADNYKDTRYNTPHNHGLSKFGEHVVGEMNRLGMMVDISHVGDDTMNDVLDVSAAPVIFSHSSVYSLCPHHRNVQDNVLRRLKHNNGIIMINFYPVFINCTLENKHDDDNRTASVSQVADHFDYVRNLIGSDHLGVGADYDGADMVGELNDVSTYPILFAELLRRGWSEQELEKVAYRNFYRVFKDVERVRDHKRHEEPDEMLIDQSEVPNQTCSTINDVWKPV
ncbi:dipeptidase 1-like [Gigantopelta aegis]|uniref:dipeptidase 1-like n=1 Tax=Gigantopelta aegis TaxID=1735272 RepID=UPI001B88A83A|nr:dipeptidase 1-like [Gigantopelta aegis]